METGSHEDAIEHHSRVADGQAESPSSPPPQLEHQVSRDLRFQNDSTHLIPSRWWFASSAFPMVAATLGPVASAFSICALGSQWRQQLGPGNDIENATFIKDPAWLTVVNAIQLCMALVSNVFLLLNMTKRVRFTVAQPITIIGWYISAILLLALIATASGPLADGLNPPSQYVWSQAFFYGIWAAILYFVDASLMVVTFWGASTGRYEKDFNLTRSQRTLMLQTIMLLMYLLLGALVFSEIEDWTYLDGVYWANVTLFTVGFGDFVATTSLARALLIPYALIGVISLGLVISSIRSMILERGRRRLDARIEEKNRRKMIRTMTKRGQDDILSPMDDDTVSNWDAENSNLPSNEFERRRSEFLLMRKIQQQASIRRKWMAMAISATVWILLWLVGAVIFEHTEKRWQQWSYFDAFYFCFISLMTIGYGDYTPISNAGKSFFVFWALLALPTMTVLISNAGDTVVKFVKDATIHVGNITILPGEEGFSHNAKYVANKVSCGFFFRNATTFLGRDSGTNVRSKSLTRLVASIPLFNMKQVNDGSREKQQDESTRSSGSAPPMQRKDADERSGKHKLCKEAEVPAGRPSLSHVEDRLDELPTGTDLHLLLVQEIQAVSQHLRESEPRRYTFEEWAWYLGLIGEDERDPQNHRKVLPKEKHKRRRRNKHKHHHHQKNTPEGQVTGGEEGEGGVHQEPSLSNAPPAAVDAANQLGVNDGRITWSWVGNHSPLMGGQEESEWILDKLMEKLQESLGELKAGEDDERS